MSNLRQCDDCGEMYLFEKGHDCPLPGISKERKCRVCGCTEVDCSQCIEKTGEPCHWVEEDLCSACQEPIT